MARMVNCVYLKKEAEGLDFAPYPGELGKRIYDGVSKEAWAAWLKHQERMVLFMVVGVVDEDVEHHPTEELLHVVQVVVFIGHTRTAQQLRQGRVAHVGLLHADGLRAQRGACAGVDLQRGSHRRG